MFVVSQLVLSGVSCGNQPMCRICILIGECCNGVEPWMHWKVLEVLECVVMPGRLNFMNDWNVWNIWNALGRSCSWNAWNAFGRSCRMNWMYSKISLSSVCRIGLWIEELSVFCMEYGVLDGYSNVECRI